VTRLAVIKAALLAWGLKLYRNFITSCMSRIEGHTVTATTLAYSQDMVPGYCFG
jgi:hypothetical protein